MKRDARAIVLLRHARVVDRDPRLERDPRVPHAPVDGASQIPRREDRHAAEPDDAARVREQRLEEPRDELLVRGAIVVPGKQLAHREPVARGRPVDGEVRGLERLFEGAHRDIALVHDGVDERRLEIRHLLAGCLRREAREARRDLLPEIRSLAEPPHPLGGAPPIAQDRRGPEREIDRPQLREQLGHELEARRFGQVAARFGAERVVVLLLGVQVLERPRCHRASG